MIVDQQVVLGVISLLMTTQPTPQAIWARGHINLLNNVGKRIAPCGTQHLSKCCWENSSLSTTSVPGHGRRRKATTPLSEDGTLDQTSCTRIKWPNFAFETNQLLLQLPCLQSLRSYLFSCYRPCFDTCHSQIKDYFINSQLQVWAGWSPSEYPAWR